MKSVHGKSATAEDCKRLKTVGSLTNPITTYSKDDYLTPAKVAKRFDISTEKAKSIMKTLIFKHATFVINGHKSPVIVNMGTGTPRLHPLAIDIFQDYLNKQKAK